MEEKSNMTAERSLEIISEQIAQARHAASQVTGQALYISGLCTMGMAVVVAIVNFIILTTGITRELGIMGDYLLALVHLLWLTLPIIIKLALRGTYKKNHAPVSLVGTLVRNTWWTFAVFAIAYFVIAFLWNITVSRIAQETNATLASSMPISFVIILLMGMSIAITGHILKHKWLTWFGIIGGLLAIVCKQSGIVIRFLFSCLSGLGYNPLALAGYLFYSEYCLAVFLLALFGLMLPGLMLKKQCE